jgi:DNA invertase Pin-like site-specific DNA recombinase
MGPFGENTMKNIEQYAGWQAIQVGRFSSDKQDEGDSRERQNKTFLRICRIAKFEPNTRIIFDAGKSAFHGRHLKATGRKPAQFGLFLEEVRQGQWLRPVVLVWEAVDRFSRMAGLDALLAAKELCSAGFALVFEEEDLLIDTESLKDPDIFRDFTEAIAAAQKYSKKLSRRMRHSWEDKRETGKPYAHCRPFWIAKENGKYVVKEPEFSQIRKACLLATEDGLGCELIRQQLGVSGKGWAGLSCILRSATLKGDFQPQARNGDERTNAGEVRHNYYPAVLTEVEWLKLQRSQDSKKKAKKGRGADKATCLFTGLLFYSDGCPMTINGQSRGLPPVLSAVKAKRTKNTRYKTILNSAVEAALLNCLASTLTPQDLMPKVNLTKERKALEEIEGKILVNKAKQEANEQDILNDPDNSAFLKRIGAALWKQGEELQEGRQRLLLAVSTCQKSPVKIAKELIGHLAQMPDEGRIEARRRLKNLLIPSIIKRVVIAVEDSKTATYTITLTSGQQIKGKDLRTFRIYKLASRTA